MSGSELHRDHLSTLAALLLHPSSRKPRPQAEAIRDLVERVEHIAETPRVLAS
jgi:hypothetical protein